MRSRFLSCFALLFVFLSVNVCHSQTSDTDDAKTSRYVVERKSNMLFDNFIYLMLKCDRYIESWQFRKKNINLYMLSKGNFSGVIKGRRDVIQEIEEKITFFENKIYTYAKVVGKLYKLAEPFIEKDFIKLDETEANSYVDEFIKHIDSVLPQNFSDSYFSDELKNFKTFAPERKKMGRKKRYAIYTVLSAASLIFVYRCRKFVINFFKKFFENQIVKPIRNLKDYLFLSYDEDDFLSMSPDEMLRDLEAQKDVLKQKIKELAVAIDKDIDPDILEDMLEKEKSMERFVARCVQKAKSIPLSKQGPGAKPGWIEWFFVGNKVNNTLGMPPRQKVLELEIKGLLSRLAATKLLFEAKDGMDANKLTVVLGSMLPVTLATYCVYTVCNKIYDWRHGIRRKKKDLNGIIFKLSDVINRNLGNEKVSDLDQGLLCYFTQRFKFCLSVIPENVRSSFECDRFYISSCSHKPDKKLQIFQSLKIMLYLR